MVVGGCPPRTKLTVGWPTQQAAWARVPVFVLSLRPYGYPALDGGFSNEPSLCMWGGVGVLYRVIVFFVVSCDGGGGHPTGPGMNPASLTPPMHLLVQA